MTSRAFATRGSTRSFLLVHLGPALILIAGLLLMDQTRLDRFVSDPFFDAASRTFPLRHDFLFDVVLYHWAKYLVVFVGGVIATAFLFSLFARALRPWRRFLAFLTLAIGLAPAVVVILRSSIHRYCPWDLEVYGGFAPHLTLFDTLTAPIAPGAAPVHCFPGGHAATGFCLLAFYFAGYALQRPLLARAGLWTGIIAGLVLGGARVAQGAHFLSHNLWTGLICWTVMVLLYALIFGSRPAAISEPRALPSDPAFPGSAPVYRGSDHITLNPEA